MELNSRWEKNSSQWRGESLTGRMFYKFYFNQTSSIFPEMIHQAGENSGSVESKVQGNHLT